MKFSRLVIMVASFFSLGVFAQDISAMGISVSKEDIRKQLETMKKSGQISNADYLKTLSELDKMDDKKIKDIQQKAIDTIQKDPSAADKLINQKLE